MNRTLIEWCACSADLNPKEHLWDELGRPVALRRHTVVHRHTLIAVLQEEWNNLPQQQTWYRACVGDVQLALKLEEDTLVIKNNKDINVVCMASFSFDSMQVFDFVFFCDM